MLAVLLYFLSISFLPHYYISTYVVFVCFCVIYSFITAVCYYFRFLFLFSTILLSHIKVLYAFVFYPVAREYYLLLLIYFSVLLLSYMKVLLCTKLLYAFVFCVVVREYPHRNEKKMSIGGGWFIFTPCAGGCALCLRFHLAGGVAISVLAALFSLQRSKAAKPSKHSRRRFSRLKTKMGGRKTAAGRSAGVLGWTWHRRCLLTKKNWKKSKTY